MRHRPVAKQSFGGLERFDESKPIESVSHTCTNQTVPYGTAPSRWRFPRHFVPGYDRTVPPGHFATGSSVMNDKLVILIQ
jgi:hypothetical protein